MTTEPAPPTASGDRFDIGKFLAGAEAEQLQKFIAKAVRQGVITAWIFASIWRCASPRFS